MALVQGKEYPEHLYYDLDNQIWYEALPDATIRAGFTPIAIELDGEVLVFTPKRAGKPFDGCVTVLSLGGVDHGFDDLHGKRATCGNVGREVFRAHQRFTARRHFVDQPEFSQGAWTPQSLQSGGMRSMSSTLTATRIVSSASPFQTPRLGGTSEKSRPTAVTTWCSPTTSARVGSTSTQPTSGPAQTWLHA